MVWRKVEYLILGHESGIMGVRGVQKGDRGHSQEGIGTYLFDSVKLDLSKEPVGFPIIRQIL